MRIHIACGLSRLSSLILLRNFSVMLLRCPRQWVCFSVFLSITEHRSLVRVHLVGPVAQRMNVCLSQFGEVMNKAAGSQGVCLPWRGPLHSHPDQDGWHARGQSLTPEHARDNNNSM